MTEPKLCAICGKVEGDGADKIDPTLCAQMFELKKPNEHWGLCAEHQKLYEENYVAIVEIAEPDSSVPGNDLSVVHRTGKIIHVKRELLKHLYDTSIDLTIPMVFCTPDVSKQIADYIKREEQTTPV